MAVADAAIKFRPPRRSARISPCERRGSALYPPRIVPRDKPGGRLSFLVDTIRDPLVALTRADYEEPLVMREAPVRFAAVSAPEFVRIVLVDRREDFDRRPDLQRYVLGRLLGDGLLLAEGADWRWQRQTAAPLFRHTEILNYVPVMSAAATAALGKWETDLGDIHDVAAGMMVSTYEVIGNTILVGGSDEVMEEIERESARYPRALQWAIAFGMFKLPTWLPRPGRTAMNRRDDNLRKIVGEMIDARQAIGSVGDDLLGRLLAAERPDTGEVMSRKQLVDNILTFLLAGHFTTASALTWTLYLIACAPEWQERLLDEIRATVPEGPVTGEHIGKLKLVQQVLKESMRLFPPVPFVTRVAVRDTELAGHEIAEGTLISIPIYAVHRHKSAWSDPDRFDPNRFAEGAEPRPASCQFLPFGAGQRICIGSAFALIEATVFLATLLRQARFDLPAPDFVPIPSSSVLLLAKHGMPLKVTMR